MRGRYRMLNQSLSEYPLTSCFPDGVSTLYLLRVRSLFMHPTPPTVNSMGLTSETVTGSFIGSTDRMSSLHQSDRHLGNFTPPEETLGTDPDFKLVSTFCMILSNRHIFDDLSFPFVCRSSSSLPSTDNLRSSAGIHRIIPGALRVPRILPCPILPVITRPFRWPHGEHGQ